MPKASQEQKNSLLVEPPNQQGEKQKYYKLEQTKTSVRRIEILTLHHPVSAGSEINLTDRNQYNTKYKVVKGVNKKTPARATTT